jgi:hypothetical protein
MNISDLNHLEVISEESITELIGAGTAFASFGTLITALGPIGSAMTIGVTITGLSTPTSASVSFSLGGSIFTE